MKLGGKTPINFSRTLLLTAALGLTAGGIVISTTGFLSAQSPDEEAVEDSHPAGAERLSVDDLVPATPYPRPDESAARSLQEGKAALTQDASLRDVIVAVENGDVKRIVELSRKGDFCATRFREPPPECKGDPVVGIYNRQIMPKPAALWPVSTAEEWLDTFFSVGAAKIEFASRDSRLPEGPGGEYFLVFKSEGSTHFDGGPEYDKLALVVTPGGEEPIAYFVFLVSSGNGLRWVQQVGGDDGAKHQRLILPASVSDLPGWFGS